MTDEIIDLKRRFLELDSVQYVEVEEWPSIYEFDQYKLFSLKVGMKGSHDIPGELHEAVPEYAWVFPIDIDHTQPMKNWYDRVIHTVYNWHMWTFQRMRYGFPPNVDPDSGKVDENAERVIDQ